MRIIDRYLLRQFVQVFVICWISLTGLYIVFDAFANLDEFLRFTEGDGGLLQLMGRYYTYRSIAFFDRMSAVLAMIAAMFTVTWIQRHNEMTALQAAGISRQRVIRPVIVAAILLSAVAILTREVVIPSLRGELTRDAKDLAGANAQPVRPQYDNATDILITGEATFAKDRRIHDPRFKLPSTLDLLERTLEAKDCYYEDATEQHPAGFRFVNLLGPSELLTQPSLRLGEQPIVFTPVDNAAWLKPGEVFVASELRFEQLADRAVWRQYASTRELIGISRNRSMFFDGSLRVAIHARIVQPVLDVTLLFLGLPLVLARENRNMFLAIGQCLSLVVCFFLCTLGSQYLGAAGLIEPALGAWLPVMFFVPLAVYMYEGIER